MHTNFFSIFDKIFGLKPKAGKSKKSPKSGKSESQQRLKVSKVVVHMVIFRAFGLADFPTNVREE
jgi:hypothetical protein